MRECVSECEREHMRTCEMNEGMHMWTCEMNEGMHMWTCEMNECTSGCGGA